jgi:hypothetical protein
MLPMATQTTTLSQTTISPQAHYAITRWVKEQLIKQDITLETLSETCHLTAKHLQGALDGYVTIKLRQWFNVAAALGYNMVDFITESKILSEAGKAYMDYSRNHNEPSLGALWKATKDLPPSDRVVLLEYVYQRQRKQW